MNAQKTSAPQRPQSVSWQPIAVVSFLVLYVALGLSASCFKSQTGDEGVHLTGGVTFWARNDYRVQPENGNLPQRWCGLPVWLSGYRLPPPEAPTWRELRQWDLGDQFIFTSGNDADAMLLRGRAMTALLGVALALVIYFWSRRLFGPLAGLLSLSLFALSPTMLTHGFLITSDMAAALFFTASVGSLWLLLRRVTPGTLLLTWLTLSGLFVSKYSAPLIVPMGLILLAIRLWNPAPLVVSIGHAREIHGRWRQLALFGALLPLLVLGVAVSIWASFGFRYAMLNPAVADADVPVPWEGVHARSELVNTVVDMGRTYHLLPEAYLYGFAHVARWSEARAAYLNGEFRGRGWISFFPYCLAVKTPLELFLLLGLAGAAALRYRATPGADVSANAASLPSSAAHQMGRLYELAPLLTLFTVYWLVALTSHLNIGHRHLLPTYPPLLILAGAAAWWIRPPREIGAAKNAGSPQNLDKPGAGNPPRRISGRLEKTMQFLVVGAVALCAVEALWIWPHYLAYFNLLIGGQRNAYRHLVDSSLDWSQDLKAVKPWLDRHPADARDPSRLYFSFYGSPPPEYYGIQFQRLPSFPERWQPHIPQPLTGGTYLISATMLSCIQTLHPGRWNKSFEAAYQELRRSVEMFARLSQLPDGIERLKGIQPPMSNWSEVLYTYETLRFSRLASYLRAREPDDQIGYSILVYRLTDADVAAALDGAPVELLDMPEAEMENLRRQGSATKTP